MYSGTNERETKLKFGKKGFLQRNKGYFKFINSFIFTEHCALDVSQNLKLKNTTKNQRFVYEWN